MVGVALDRAVDAVIVRAKNRSTRHHADIGQRGQFGLRLFNPVRAGHVGKRPGVRQKTPTQTKIFVRKDHLRARTACGQCCSQTRRSRADHQKITMQKPFVIGIGIALAG